MTSYLRFRLRFRRLLFNRQKSGQYARNKRMAPRAWRLLTEDGIFTLKSSIRKEQHWLRENILSLIALIIACSSAFFAYRQSSIAEQSMKYANRPYIIVDGIRQNTNDRYSFEISNFGSTPSYYTKIYYEIFTDDTSFTPPNEYAMVIDNVSVIGGNTNRRQVRIKVGNMFRPDTLEKLEARNEYVFCAGKIEYQDIFKDKHSYYFCFKKSTDPGFSKFRDYNYPFSGQ